ncbi:MAG: PIG-L family deacetylase [Phycisphaerae bacterium]
MSTDQTLDILFAAPHPDDLEIGCGGWIAKLVSQGYRVGMVHLTNGEPTPLGTPETRAKEARAAAEILGVAHMEMLPLTNRELMDGPAARYALATVVRRFRARVLVSFAGKTVAASPDHLQGQLIAEAARFYSQLTKWDERFDHTAPHRVDHLVLRPVARTPENMLWPATFVVDITDTIDKKLAAIACYRSQFPAARFKGLEHFVRSTAGYEGGQAGFDSGELYALPRPIGVADAMPLFGSWPRIDPTRMKGD